MWPSFVRIGVSKCVWLREAAPITVVRGLYVAGPVMGSCKKPAEGSNAAGRASVVLLAPLQVHILHGGKTQTAHIRPELGARRMRGSKPAGFSGVGKGK